MQQKVTTGEVSADAAILRALAKAAVNPKRSSALDELLKIVGRVPDDGFPEAPAGDARGENDLARTNWFNGRFLTAEALRRQDAYTDARARLLAQAQMPGVAWGLGLRASGLNATPVWPGIVIEGPPQPLPRTGGLPAQAEIELSEGLAFDMAGRPILVARPFRFRLADLVAEAVKRPRRVVPVKTEFSPCVCLADDPAGPTGGGVSARPGPYLLVIEAGETPEGEARIAGQACAAPDNIACQADFWRGGFGLSLARFPVEIPDGPEARTAWDLRGMLSAYFFDVFEHPLFRRWDPPFALDNGWGDPHRPGRHEAGTVALAMVFLGQDGSALFMDSWVPRRGICATPAEDHHRLTFGAPPRAASWARMHQFQQMLAESLRVEPLRKPANSQSDRPQTLSLLQRGFRHIPPIGFLPLSPVRPSREGSTGVPILDAIVKAGGSVDAFASPYVAEAVRQARTYFAGTNVLAYATVALHDDDILEDLSNVFDKDPVRIAAPPLRSASTIEGSNILLAIARALQQVGLDDLVNRRVEIVKLVIPLQGLSRPQPILGVIDEDAAAAAAWTGGALPSQQAAVLAGAAARRVLDMLPRHVAVYVKQRMVLLDILFVLLEVLQALFELAQQMRDNANGRATNGIATTADFRAAYQAQPAEKRAMVDAALAQPEIRTTVARAAVAAVPDLQVAARQEQFAAAVQAQDAQLATQIPDATERRRVALERVSDSFAAELPGFQVAQVLTAVQPPEAAETSLSAIRIEAAKRPQIAVAAPQGDVRVFADANAARLYGAVAAAANGRPASDLVAGAPADISVKDVLAKPEAEAARAVGGEANLAALRTALAAQKEEAAKAAEEVVAAPPSAELQEKLAAALAAEGGDAEKAVARVKTETAGDAAATAQLNRTEALVRAAGKQQAGAIALSALTRRT